MAPETVAVIPFYGVTGADHEELIATVASALAVVDYVLIADDASPCRASIDHDRVSVVRCDHNRGPGPAINDALDTLAGDWTVCRLDCRDSWMLDAKARQLSGPCNASFSWTLDPISGETRMPHPRWPTRMRTDNQFASSGIVFYLDTWRKVGGYSDTLRWGEDWDFALRVQQAVGWTEHVEVTATHGEHPGGLSDVRGNPTKAKARAADIQRVRQFARSLR